MYIILLILISLIFLLQDKYILKITKNRFKKLTLLRPIISSLLGIILFYITTKNFLFTCEININNAMIVLSILVIINLFINLLLLKKYNTNNRLNMIRNVSKIILVILTLECTLFNYKHYLTFSNNEVKIDEYKLENLVKVNDTYYYENKDESSGLKIDIKNIDVNSIYLKILDKNNNLLTYNIDVLDNYSDKFINLNSTNCYNGIEQTYYKTIYNSYESNILYIFFSNNSNSQYQIDTIILNPNIPINFSLTRVIILLIISIIGYALRPNSILYKIKFNTNKRAANITIIIFLILTILTSCILTNLNKVFLINNYYEYRYAAPSVNEYQLLAEALAEGQLYLLEEPSPILKDIENPYNTTYREMMFEDSNEYYIWDTSYFNNHYYVYFGIVPVIFTYLPVYLLTGQHISNNTVILIGLIGIILEITFLLKQLVNKYFKNITIGSYMIMLIFSMFCNHFVILYAARRPDFYSIPIIWGIMFSLLGINLWLKSKNTDGSITKRYLLLGSLSMALVAGCRPQLLLSSFSAIILFWNELKIRKIFSLKSIKETLCFCLPYFIIVSLIMTYNYARFGSVFDFGANYNLTTNDMTARGFNLERIGLGIYYYLLAIPNLNNIFPFIGLLTKSTNYIGITIFEEMFGGILSLSPVLLICFGIPKFKKYFKSKMLYYLSLWFTISALIIIIADTNMAGILPRYCIDFSWLLVISSVIIIFNFIEFFKDNSKISYIINKLLYLSIFFLLILNFFLTFVDLSFSYKDIIPNVFYKLYYIIQFWL